MNRSNPSTPEPQEPLVRNISDTARWVAYYRAQETDRPDAAFRDPYARALAGDRGTRIATTQEASVNTAWAFVARTVLFDRYIQQEVRAGADLIVNLAAGLDARPYRMDLPASLRWVEVDLPGILDYKESVLKDATPTCRLERVRLDLSAEDARCALFAGLGASCRRAVIVSEGFLIYLDTAQVASLARDLAAVPSFRAWIAELASPGLLEMMTKRRGAMLEQAGAPFRFAPPEGSAFFEPLGWKAVEVASLVRVGRELKRLPPLLRLLSMLPEPKKRPPSRPWSGVCRFERQDSVRAT